MHPTLTSFSFIPLWNISFSSSPLWQKPPPHFCAFWEFDLSSELIWSVALNYMYNIEKQTIDWCIYALTNTLLADKRTKMSRWTTEIVRTAPNFVEEKYKVSGTRWDTKLYDKMDGTMTTRPIHIKYKRRMMSSSGWPYAE